ncbi:MAG: YbaB/EbfC family nucleoid-associated protein [Deltaproteobacteria bacterium]|nr:YbaB/EbfC family nucleoid-associated protein [Deltaproteobacteria bacterium]
MKNVTELLQMAKKAQEQIASAQAELATKTVTAVVGGGMVEAVFNGKMECVSLRIKPEVVDPKELEMLQELILAAVNDGVRRAQAMANEEIGKIAGGLKLPGIL